MAILDRRGPGARPSTAQGHRAPPDSGRSADAAPVASNPPITGYSAAAASEEIGLIERARSGDAAAFDALVALRLMPTFRLVRAILGRAEESEDCAQEAFIAAWRGLPSLRKPERFDAWFTRIVVNACRMSMRRRPRAVIVSIESIGEDQASLAEDPGLSGLVDSDTLNRAIDGLPIHHRAILALYYLEDRPVSTVAMLLGIPTGTAKWRLSRARMALRRAMAGDDPPVLSRLPREVPPPASLPLPLPGETA
jgi:RNA polymerase sigma-70 factor (ECF subfamily)